MQLWVSFPRLPSLTKGNWIMSGHFKVNGSVVFGTLTVSRGHHPGPPATRLGPSLSRTVTAVADLGERRVGLFTRAGHTLCH